MEISGFQIIYLGVDDMCGIAGFFVKSNIQDYVQQLLQATAVVKHRGPDAHSTWTRDGVGLGHTRLSILDLTENGNQPMVSVNGRYTIIFNGQVYNYLELANKLDLKFKNCSDTRIVLETIAKLGVEKAVEQFNGMFAFAVYDDSTKKLYLVRDAIGIKPLYWGQTNDGYIFASELKSLREFKNFDTRVNNGALASYFRNQYVKGSLSIYAQAQKLLPGHILEISEAGVHPASFKPRTGSYSQIKSVLEAEDVLQGLLIDSITRHARSDVPFSAFLSGGVDSSLIVSILSKQSPVSTYSIGYDEKDYDESQRAQQIAAYLGVPHSIIQIRPEDIKFCLDNIANMYDEPFADPSCLPTHILSNVVAKQTKIAFSGDGADELFAGYPRYFSAANEWGRFSYIPYPFRKILAHSIDKPVFSHVAKLMLNNPTASIPYLKRVLSNKSVWQMFCQQNYLGLPDNIVNYDHLREEATTERFDSVSRDQLLSHLLLKDQEFRLPDAMLTKVDRASMASSLEIRVPFLDNELVAFSRAIYADPKLHGAEPKLILKQLLAKYLPRQLFDMPKTGFHIPMKRWLAEHYSTWAEDLLFSNHAKDDLLNSHELRKMWVDYRGGNHKLFYPLWTALMYKQWQLKFG